MGQLGQRQSTDRVVGLGQEVVEVGRGTGLPGQLESLDYRLQAAASGTATPVLASIVLISRGRSRLRGGVVSPVGGDQRDLDTLKDAQTASSLRLTFVAISDIGTP